MSATESPEEIVERIKAERERRSAARRVLVAVTGSRSGKPSREQLRRFWNLFDEAGGTELHHGDCEGVDRAVALNAANLRPGLPVVPHPANWYPDGPRGRLDRSAGPKRNEHMMSLCTVLIAFPGNRGTDSCLRVARRYARRILFVEEQSVPTPPSTPRAPLTEPTYPDSLAKRSKALTRDSELAAHQQQTPSPKSSTPPPSAPCEAVLLWDSSKARGITCHQSPARRRKTASGRWTWLCEDCEAWAHRAGLLAPFKRSPLHVRAQRDAPRTEG